MAEFDMTQALQEAQMLAEQRHSEIMRLRRANDDMLAALENIIAREDKAWMPMRAFRSEQQAELDEVRHEVWQEAADIARAAIADAKGPRND